jgi:hypothetical protein
MGEAKFPRGMDLQQAIYQKIKDPMLEWPFMIRKKCIEVD